jgi:N-dimethylarginine dimethylaminohydrolase
MYNMPMTHIINRTVLMSGADYFDDGSAINPYMNEQLAVDVPRARQEHARIRDALEAAGITVVKVDPPAGCQDGVYTANWALVRGDTAVLAHLPNAREKEVAALGKTVVHVPNGWRFSGQGDALPCNNYLLAGSTYRADPEAQAFAAQTLGYELVQLQTIPQLDAQGQPAINAFSGWPDSFFYDIDLALAVIRPGLIAYCPQAFTPESQAKIKALNLEKIEISLQEATESFACNLVSTGETVIMSNQAPGLQAELEARGLKTITLEIAELLKGGGFIRCTSLTLDNPSA